MPSRSRVRCWSAIGAGLLAAGCAAGPAWRKPGATEAEVARDVWECEQPVVPFTKLSPTTGRSARVRTNRDERAACLRARGHEPIPSPARPKAS